eukprot:CAMPEP_0198197444 /NCGR_PEP_ID=MMETSP1445-20131203/1069_1 /TAXON_ID=36898 /ORGANISM="Pyramimonas sp., Strain CCMP2087" /LENGTH=390 /DNA_ID=CAMNT_0043866741 /DNA_START=212 /DNA_END=1384 /DNA_ORIENTATION=+
MRASSTPVENGPTNVLMKSGPAKIRRSPLAWVFRASKHSTRTLARFVCRSSSTPFNRQEGGRKSESRLKSNAMVPSQQQVGVERLYTEEDLDVGTVLACVSGQSWRELAGTNSPLAVVGLDFTMRTVSVLNWLEKKTLGTVRSLARTASAALSNVAGDEKEDEIFKVYPTVMDYAEMADGDTVYSFSPYDDELQLIQNEMEELRKIKDKATIEVEALFENQKKVSEAQTHLGDFHRVTSQLYKANQESIWLTQMLEEARRRESEAEMEAEEYKAAMENLFTVKDSLETALDVRDKQLCSASTSLMETSTVIGGLQKEVYQAQRRAAVAEERAQKMERVNRAKSWPSLKVPKKNAHKFERERGSSWTGTGEAEAYDRQELKALPEGSNYFI